MTTGTCETCSRALVANAAAIFALSMMVMTSPSAATTGAMNALRTTTDYQQAVFKGAQKTTAWINNKCEGGKATLGTTLGMVAVPVFDDRGHPQSGAWIEHVSVMGCGADRLLNVLVVIQSPGKFATIALLPGTTRADPKLEKDGAVFAFTAARIDPKGCTPIYLFDTQFQGFSSETPTMPGKPAWTEVWTVAQCEARLPVTMTFTPDKTGTVITAKVRKAMP